jgi:predicted glutamine amidotransferase
MRRTLVFTCLTLTMALVAALAWVEPGRTDSQEERHECRFWGIVSPRAPRDVVISHLDSLELITQPWPNVNGWGIGYYPNVGDPCRLKRPFVLRGTQQARYDPEYDYAKYEAASREPKGAIAHVRQASSGLTYLPNPHPFVRRRDGWPLLFAHNGTISQMDSLRNRISDEYFNANPPDYKNTYQSDPWGFIDSELYFMLILDRFESAPPGMSTEDVIREAVAEIDTAMSNAGVSSKLNFVMTDGDTLWAVRFADSSPQNYTLYYQGGWISEEVVNPFYWVAASVQMDDQFNWFPMDNYTLITFVAGNRLVIVDIPHVE